MNSLIIYFGNEAKYSVLIDTALFLKKNYNFNIIPLYIKDISQSKLLSSTAETMMLGSRSSLILDGMAEIEKENIENIQELLKNKKIEAELMVEIGTPSEVISDKMKLADMLITGKTEILSDKKVSILKDNYKSILFVGNIPLKSLKNPIIANDDGVKINKSCYHFTQTFENVDVFDAIMINNTEKYNHLTEYMKNKGKILVKNNFNSDNYDEILKEIDKHDVLIMGNLSRHYFFEKIVGKNGVKLLEKVKIPVFIG